jgi:uncharacterized protein (TIGR03000 family)
MFTNRLSFAWTCLLVTAAVFGSAAPVQAQFRGGSHAGPVGGIPPGIGASARPVAPIFVPAQRFGPQTNYAYRPNSGYIPNVGYYLPNASPASRVSRYVPDYLGSSGEPAPPAPAETFPTGQYFFSTPAVDAPQKGYPAEALNLDTVVEPDLTARVTVRLPSDAELWFDNAKVPSAGTVREFRTPALKPGRLYDYEVRARWQQAGRAVTQRQQVAISAGADVRVDFTPATGTAP